MTSARYRAPTVAECALRAAAHRAGVAHRDVRPANVLFDDDEHPYLADFGIAVEDPDDDAAHDDVAGLAEVALQLLGRLDPVAGVELEPRRSVLRRACAGEIATIVDLHREWRLACGATTSSTPTPDRPRARRRTPGPIGNPYKGLRPFTEAERGDFFGRVHACEQLVAVVAERPFVVVVGPSGSGKSSLVLAGLVPRLRDGSHALIGTPGSPVKRIELDPRRWLEMACDAAGRNLTRAEWARYFGAIADYDVTCPQYPPGR